jgi:hypothetical protein
MPSSGRADPDLHAICDGLLAAKIDALLRKWLRPLPHPFIQTDRKAGYRYDDPRLHQKSESSRQAVGSVAIEARVLMKSRLSSQNPL